MAEDYFKHNWFLSIFLGITGVALSLLNVHWVNLAVKFYDQTDVIPIYMAFGLVAEMLCGLIIGGEFKLYNGGQLFGILLGSVITVAGVGVLVKKRSQLRLGEEKSTEDDESQSNLIATEKKQHPFSEKLVEIFTKKREREIQSEETRIE